METRKTWYTWDSSPEQENAAHGPKAQLPKTLAVKNAAVACKLDNMNTIIKGQEQILTGICTLSMLGHGLAETRLCLTSKRYNIQGSGPGLATKVGGL